MCGETVNWEATHRAPGSNHDVDLAGAAAPLADGDGRVVGGISVVSDVTERHHAAAMVEHLALHDPLTDLANRALFHDRLGQALEGSRRAKTKVAVAVINLDEFKSVNDAARVRGRQPAPAGGGQALSKILRGGDTLAGPAETSSR